MSNARARVTRLDHRRILAMVSGLAIALAVVVGCTQTVTGTPRADPAQTGIPLSPGTGTTRSPSTQTSTSSPTAAPSSGPSTVPTRTSGAAPADVDTTCSEYDSMDDAGKRAVIAAIGKQNDVVALNPELWISVAGALCSFADPGTTVQEVLSGQGIG
jgi:hypothetical protein